ncbi:MULTISPECIES: hypothetical protein [Curtobacterium]|jgi:hypothetical protein|uniref:DUF2946 domain-containing protein n=1 Tax=Curtobacterium subtropicum TaxID=3055138 RepID=A0ABT7TFC6_9MICO|nr:MULTISPECIES: hypothetical protein [Curtobacterium]MDM7888306.1 hypothetical protein [Curtobacterium subtropicum]PZO57000.1 MAG: hypothetical protein DI639_14630 [Leifsonia xyli]SBN63205.1 hypothetical protein GA0004736_2128 [Curtobacterium sp. 9128]
MIITTSPRRRLLLQVTATMALLLLVGFTVLMHTMAGHTADPEHPMTAPTAAMEHHPAAATSHTAATGHAQDVVPAVAVKNVLSDAGCDGGLCALMCSLMGMACMLTIALFAWVLLRARSGGVLHLLARLLALAAHVARRVAAPRPPSLSALQIIRV